MKISFRCHTVVFRFLRRSPRHGSGATGKDSPSIVGMLTHEKVGAEVMTIRIDEKPHSLMEKGLLRAVLRVCRLVSGMAQSVESKAAAASSLPELDPVGNKPEPGPPITPLTVGPQVAVSQVF